MKNAQKLIALVLALVMVLSLSVTALAAGSSSDADEPAGSITIKNADVSQTYSIYQVFDVEYSTKSDGSKTATYMTNNPDLIALIEAQQMTKEAYDAIEVPSNADRLEEPVCPFVVGGVVDGKPDFRYISHVDPDNEIPGRGWLAKYMTEEYKYTPAGATDEVTLDPWLNDDVYTETKVAEDFTLTFNEVPYGYYLVTTSTGPEVTVNSNMPNVEVLDKNPKTPHEPKKEEDRITIDGGEEITFTSSLYATNYKTTGTSNVNPIDEYKLVDYWTDGLTFDIENSIVSVELYSVGEDEDGNETLTLYKTLTEMDQEDAEDYVADQDYASLKDTYWLELIRYDDTNKKVLAADAATGKEGFRLHMPWADFETTEVETDEDHPEGLEYELKEFFYETPVKIVVKYTMVANDEIFNVKDNFSATNTAVYYYDDFNEDTNKSKKDDGGTTPVSVKVYTFGLSLRKTDDNTTTPQRLPGAEFIVYRKYQKTVEVENETYKVFKLADGTEYYLIPAHKAPGANEGDPEVDVPDTYYKVSDNSEYVPDEQKAATWTVVYDESQTEYYQLREQKTEKIGGVDQKIWVDADGKEYYRVPLDTDPVTYEFHSVETYTRITDEATIAALVAADDPYATVQVGSNVFSCYTIAEIPDGESIEDHLYYKDPKTAATTDDDQWYKINVSKPVTDADLANSLKPAYTNKVLDYTNGNLDNELDGQNYTAHWVANRADASRVVADNNYQTMEVIGVKEGTYFIEETKAPAGYKLPENPFIVTVTAQNNGIDGLGNPGNTFTAAGDRNGNTEGITVENKTVTESDYSTVIIQNGTTKEMPTTGGAGTVALLAFGAMAFLSTGVILVTKKRMYNAG